jgi:hypothetical protein
MISWRSSAQAKQGVGSNAHPHENKIIEAMSDGAPMSCYHAHLVRAQAAQRRSVEAKVCRASVASAACDGLVSSPSTGSVGPSTSDAVSPASAPGASPPCDQPIAGHGGKAFIRAPCCVGSRDHVKGAHASIGVVAVLPARPSLAFAQELGSPINCW